MLSLWRQRRSSKNGGIKSINADGKQDLEISIPNHFRCPISLDLMKDPVTLSTGITYDRESIEKWVEAGNQNCPVTNQALTSVDLIPNHAIRRMIQDWCIANNSYGIDRIPTPRIPVSPIQVIDMLSSFKSATQRGDQTGCLQMAHKIKFLMKESERNKQCIVKNGTCAVLSASFESFATSSIEKNAEILVEILESLTEMLPLDIEAKSHLGSRVSLSCMEWFLKSGDTFRRRNTVLVLRDTVSKDEKYVLALAEVDGVVEPLVKLIKEPICPASKKASLMVIYYLMSASAEHKTRFAKTGLVSLLIEALVVSDKSTSEKALAVLDATLGCKEGREQAYSHALAVPILIKKLLRVSDLATEFAVSAVWELCKNETREEGGLLVEALRVGAFQKILLLLQIGCADKTKEKSSELLKLLNTYRGRVECNDLMDFRMPGRPF